MEDDSLEDYIRILRNTKEDKPIKKEVLVTALRKKECQTKAMKMVEFMIDGRLRPEPFLKCLPYIDQNLYQDIVEERAIGSVCGYPLCGKTIPDMPKKQYHISSKSNKVFDITERKKFCSNYCYSASTHVKKQIDDSPLWLRKYETAPNFNLLDKKHNGAPGEEVLHVVRSVIEEDFTSVSSLTEVLLGEMEEKEIKSKSKSKPKKQKTPNMVTISESEEEDDLVEQTARSDLIETKGITKSDAEATKTTTARATAPIKSASCSSVLDKSEIETQLEKCFKQWLTVDTLCFIHGEEKMKTVLDAHKMSDYFDAFKVAELEIEQQKRYAEICRRLHLREFAEDKFDSNVTGNNTKLRPIPDYKDLKEKNKEMVLKVKSYFDGEMQEKSDTNFPEARQEEEEEGTPRIMPLADVNSQKALRRRVFLNSVHKSMQTHAKSLKIHSSIVSNVQGLVKTFNLSPDNVMFKPTYWNYITLTLLRILSLRDGALKAVLEQQRSLKYFQMNWDQLPGKGRFVDDVMEAVQDVDTFMRCVINEE